MCHLTCLLITGNQLSGAIPPFTGGTTSTVPYLKDMLLSNNQLTGSVPDAIFSLPQAYRIDLVNFDWYLLNTNFLSVCICERQCWSLQGGNRLTGTVPAPQDNTLPLRMVFLDYNQLSGNLPELTLAGHMLVMDVSNNQLAGSISGVASTSADAADYAARYVALDATYGCAVDVDFGDNQLVGSLPLWLPTLPFEVRSASF